MNDGNENPAETNPTVPVTQNFMSNNQSQQNQQVQSPQVASGVVSPKPPTSRSWGKIFVYLFIFVVIILLVGSVAYAYFNKIGPFAEESLSEEAFLSTLVQQTNKIDQATYNIGLSVNVVAREPGAKPFDISRLDTESREALYARDHERSIDIQKIERGLREKLVQKKRVLPNSLRELDKTIDIEDPLTLREYGYEKIDDTNYKLIVTFETPEAIRAVRQSNYSIDDTPGFEIDGRKVTFNRSTKNYFYGLYIDKEQPKPLLVQWGEYAKKMPPEFSMSGDITASVTEGAGDISDWILNLNASGDLGDLAYRFNADAIKKGEDFYFKINNIPSVFLFGVLADLKGQWVSVSSEVASTSPSEYGNFYVNGIRESNEEFLKYKSQFVSLARTANEIANKHNLFFFTQRPQTEEINGRQLTQYSLGIRREAILPFYNDLEQALLSDPDLEKFAEFITDDSYREYLASEDFKYIFDYYEANTSHNIWLDSQNYPAIIVEKWRLVPPDEAAQLADKQVEWVVRLELTDINKSIKIEAPDEATPIEEMFNKIIADEGLEF